MLSTGSEPTQTLNKEGEEFYDVDINKDVFIRDARAAAVWLESHKHLFSRPVLTPSVLHYNTEDARVALRNLRSDEYTTDEDWEENVVPFYFVFHNVTDMELFMMNTRDKLDLKVFVLALEEQLPQPVEGCMELANEECEQHKEHLTENSSGACRLDMYKNMAPKTRGRRVKWTKSHTPDIAAPGTTTMESEVEGVDLQLCEGRSEEEYLSSGNKAFDQPQGKSLAPSAQLIITRLKEENRALREERDYWRVQLKDFVTSSTQASAGAQQPQRPLQGKVKRRSPSSSESCRSTNGSSDTSSSSATTSDSSSEENDKKRRMKKKLLKRKRLLQKRQKKSKYERNFGKRATKPDEVLRRYNILLKHFQQTKSMSATLQKLKVDRKTVSLTAAIAEMYLAGQKEDIPDYKDGMTLRAYARLCKDLIKKNESLTQKITRMKTKGDLLPFS